MGKGYETLEETQNRKDEVDSAESFLTVKCSYAKAGMGLVSVTSSQQHEGAIKGKERRNAFLPGYLEDFLANQDKHLIKSLGKCV